MDHLDKAPILVVSASNPYEAPTFDPAHETPSAKNTLVMKNGSVQILGSVGKWMPTLFMTTFSSQFRQILSSNHTSRRQIIMHEKCSMDDFKRIVKSHSIEIVFWAVSNLRANQTKMAEFALLVDPHRPQKQF